VLGRVDRCFRNEGLRLQQITSFTVTGNKIEGTFESGGIRGILRCALRGGRRGGVNGVANGQAPDDKIDRLRRHTGRTSATPLTAV
jgi:hypothetical protein